METGEKLVGLIEELTNKLKAKEEKEAALEARQKALEGMTAEQKAKIEKLESTVIKLNVSIPGLPSMEIYKGHALNNQLRIDPKYAIVDNHTRESVAKFILDAIEKGSSNPNKEILLNDMTEGSGTSVGAGVFAEFSRTLLVFATLQSAALQNFRIQPMGSLQYKYIRNTGFGSVSWESEQADVDQAENTYDNVTLTAVRLGSFAKITNEALNDAVFDVVSDLMTQTTQGIGQAIDARAFGNNGTYGLAGAAITQHIDLSAGGLVMPDGGDALDEMQAMVPANKVVNPRYFMHRMILHKIKVLKDENDNYVYCSPAGSLPGTIWETPYTKVEIMTATDSTGDVCVLFAADPKQYVIGQRADISLLVNPYTYAKSYQTEFVFQSRWGHAILQPTCFVKLVG